MSDVEFCGERFALTDGTVALAPLIKLARAAQRGADTSDAAGLIALGDLVEALLAEHEVDRFDQHATRQRADGDAYMRFVEAAIGALSERPTARPSSSSGGPSTTTGSSAAGSSSPATDPLAARPDLQLIRRQAQRTA